MSTAIATAPAAAAAKDASRSGPSHLHGQPSRNVQRRTGLPDSSRRTMTPLRRSVCPSTTVFRHCQRDRSRASAAKNPSGGCGRFFINALVPSEEPEWRSAPFRLARSGDTWVGRGTADMKGFLALAINRLAGLDPSRLRRPLALLLTYDEEVGTLGARRLTETFRGTLPRSAVIGEPTSLRVARVRRGRYAGN